MTENNYFVHQFLPKWFKNLPQKNLFIDNILPNYQKTQYFFEKSAYRDSKVEWLKKKGEAVSESLGKEHLFVETLVVDPLHEYKHEEGAMVRLAPTAHISNWAGWQVVFAIFSEDFVKGSGDSQAIAVAFKGNPHKDIAQVRLFSCDVNKQKELSFIEVGIFKRGKSVYKNLKNFSIETFAKDVKEILEK